MKNLKAIVITVIGASAFMLALTLNLHHAANDYGVLTENLNIKVLAQTNTSGGGSTSGGSTTGDDKELNNQGRLPSVSFNWLGKEYQGQAGTNGASWLQLWPAVVDCTIYPEGNATWWCMWGTNWIKCSSSGLSGPVSGFKMRCVYGWGNCNSSEQTCAAWGGATPPSYLPPSHF